MVTVYSKSRKKLYVLGKREISDRYISYGNEKDKVRYEIDRQELTICKFYKNEKVESLTMEDLTMMRTILINHYLSEEGN